jgi:hypothetical protein
VVQLNEGLTGDGLQAILFVSCGGRLTATAKVIWKQEMLDVTARQGPSLKSSLESILTVRFKVNSVLTGTVRCM